MPDLNLDRLRRKSLRTLVARGIVKRTTHKEVEGGKRKSHDNTTLAALLFPLGFGTTPCLPSWFPSHIDRLLSRLLSRIPCLLSWFSSHIHCLLSWLSSRIPRLPSWLPNRIPRLPSCIPCLLNCFLCLPRWGHLCLPGGLISHGIGAGDRYRRMMRRILRWNRESVTTSMRIRWSCDTTGVTEGQSETFGEMEKTH